MSAPVKREFPPIPPQYIIRLPQGRDKQGKPKPDKEFITSEGLIYLGHLQGLKRVTSDHILLPTFENPSAIVRCEVETDLGVFTGYGEVSPLNKGTVGGTYPLSMAETRARNRALRIATGCPLTSYEELGSASGEEAPAGADPQTGEVTEAPMSKAQLAQIGNYTRLLRERFGATDLPAKEAYAGYTAVQAEAAIAMLVGMLDTHQAEFEAREQAGEQALPEVDPPTVQGKGDGLFPDGVREPVAAGAT